MGQVVDNSANLEVSQRRRTSIEGTLSRLCQQIALHPVWSTLLIALTVRVLLALFLTIVFGGSLVPDDTTYTTMASQVAAGERYTWDAYTHELYRSAFAFLGVISAIYSVVGPVKLVAQLYVGLLGALVAAATTMIALRFLKPREAVVAGFAVALLPSQALWSSLILKDATVWVALSGLGVAAALAARAVGLRLLGLGATAGILLIVLAYSREHTLVVASLALALASLAGSGPQKLLRIGGAVVLAGSIPWLVGIGPAGLTLITDSGSLEQRRINNAIGAQSAFVKTAPTKSEPSVADEIEALKVQITELREKAAELERSREPSAGTKRKNLLAQAEALESRAAEIQPPEAESPGEAEAAPLDPSLQHLPTGLSAMLLEPVPWRAGGSSTLQLARLEALIWYPLLLLAVIGLWASRKHLSSLAFPVLAGGGMLIVYALTEGNIGTAFRHRGEFVWVVALLAALGLHEALAWRRGRLQPTEMKDV